ncbi:hypothetical protein K9L67_04290 [Candidatus Woesearchaeota archaeon]|nr:hypothetical protein [Candidatus Woesearchaeota archaeon]MCF7901418.1 hypothetical protein [Candidatus Woesearchaeota archaeon]MCF8012969.1 hypothetical protein [Candidatus Woesearchaeota archaeon]
MPHILSQRKILLPSTLESLTEENFIQYQNWQTESLQITKFIINTFKDALKKESKHSDENRPNFEQKEIIKISNNYSFQITTKPTMKKPAYANVLDEFQNYVNFLLEQYENNILRKDIMTIDNEPYVSIEDVKNKLEEEIENSMNGKEGISQSIKLINPIEYNENIKETITVSFTRDYSKLSESNNLAFLDSELFLNEGKKRTNDFKELLFEDAMKILGDAPTEAIQVEYPFSKTTFIYQLEPRTTVKYKQVLDALSAENELPKNITVKTKISDFKKIELYFSDLKSKLIEKGIIDDDFKNTYSPSKRGDRIFIRLNGLKDSLVTYKNKNESNSLEKNLTLYLN